MNKMTTFKLLAVSGQVLAASARGDGRGNDEIRSCRRCCGFR